MKTARWLALMIAVLILEPPAGTIVAGTVASGATPRDRTAAGTGGPAALDPPSGRHIDRG